MEEGGCLAWNTSEEGGSDDFLEMSVFREDVVDFWFKFVDYNSKRNFGLFKKKLKK